MEIVFPLNGAQISFFTMLVTITVYAVVSLFTCHEDFNMDQMLHREAYSGISSKIDGEVKEHTKRGIDWGKIIGFDENFTLGDKWIAGGLFTWTVFFFLVTVLGTLWNIIQPWPPAIWSGYWHITAILIPILMAIITGIWFTWGGLIDTFDLFRRLRLQPNNPLDDGRVVEHQNLDEYEIPEKTSK